MWPLLFLVLGAALLIAATRFRLGRTPGSRSWVGVEQLERSVLVTLPLLGVLGIAGGVIGWSDRTGPVRTLAGGVFAIAFVTFLLWGPLQLPLPRAALPRWYRERTAQRTAAGHKREKRDRDVPR